MAQGASFDTELSRSGYRKILQFALDGEIEVLMLQDISHISNSIKKCHALLQPIVQCGVSLLVDGQPFEMPCHANHMPTPNPLTMQKEGKEMRNNIHDYPFLRGDTQVGTLRIGNDYDSIADFICEYGPIGDTNITTPLHETVLDTYGLFVNRCFDPGFMEKLRAVLVPKQMEMESRMFSEETPHSVVFSVLSISSKHGHLADCIANGIPHTLDDMKEIPNFEDGLSDIGDYTQYTVKAKTYKYGEGEIRNADPGQLTELFKRSQEDPEWLDSLPSRGVSSFTFDWDESMEFDFSAYLGAPEDAEPGMEMGALG